MQEPNSPVRWPLTRRGVGGRIEARSKIQSGMLQVMPSSTGRTSTSHSAGVSTLAG
ncbi:hypothetical protein FA13DRAFT_1094368 [Coprinellus micaceus]|uniref:Uncharacterized protein n=1 Tax=Coprinellus micaceus TaxID=71717 RepID=A0A4Y7TSX8_COPMI|nr:hypothetical protein FA13DRAFT_1094368 [Coprinellus micaceus]